MIMKTDAKVKVVSDLSRNEVDLENIIVFCVNIYADSMKSHDCTTVINDASTRMIRVERAPDSPTQVFALIHERNPELARWYPVTVTRTG